MLFCAGSIRLRRNRVVTPAACNQEPDDAATSDTFVVQMVAILGVLETRDILWKCLDLGLCARYSSI